MEVRVSSAQTAQQLVMPGSVGEREPIQKSNARKIMLDRAKCIQLIYVFDATLPPRRPPGSVLVERP